MTRDTGTGLVRYDAMCRAIDAAYAVDEVKAIHDQAAMLQAAARVAHNVEAETRAYEIRMRAARKAGALSKKIEKAQGQRNDLGTSGDRPQKSKVLEEAGIAPRTASDWERLDDIPDAEFESALATKSVRDLIDKPSAGAITTKDLKRVIEEAQAPLKAQIEKLKKRLEPRKSTPLPYSLQAAGVASALAPNSACPGVCVRLAIFQSADRCLAIKGSVTI